MAPINEQKTRPLQASEFFVLTSACNTLEQTYCSNQQFHGKFKGVDKQETAMSASSAETFARQVANEPTVEAKLNKLARAIVELARSVNELHDKIDRLPKQ